MYETEYLLSLQIRNKYVDSQIGTVTYLAIGLRLVNALSALQMLVLLIPAS